MTNLMITKKKQVKTWREKCEKLEKEKSELAAKKESSDLVDLDTLHQARQEKHKLQKEVIGRVQIFFQTVFILNLKKKQPI